MGIKNKSLEYDGLTTDFFWKTPYSFWIAHNSGLVLSSLLSVGVWEHKWMPRKGGTGWYLFPLGLMSWGLAENGDFFFPLGDVTFSLVVACTGIKTFQSLKMLWRENSRLSCTICMRYLCFCVINYLSVWSAVYIQRQNLLCNPPEGSAVVFFSLFTSSFSVHLILISSYLHCTVAKASQ